MRIILLGFRYSGKSTIGRVLAKINNLRFVDIDEEIEIKQKQTIDEIVDKEGWKHFRALEFEECKNLINYDNVVISFGGGFAVNDFFYDEERDFLKQYNGIKILFEIDKDTLVERIKKSKQRPSFDDKNDIITENINLYDKRYNDYNSLDFDIKIDTSNDEICNAILHKKLCCVIGNPVWHSLSPKIHNFLYKTTNLNDFVYTKCEIKPEKFDKFKDIVKILNLRGISITSPYKQDVIRYVDVLDNNVIKIGAVNTIFVDNFGKLYGYNTDYIGVLMDLENHVDLTNKRIAIFGSGGGSKSATIACLKKTKHITLFNRTKEKNNDFASSYGITNCSLNEFKAKDFDIIINATIVGLGTNKSILQKKQILKNHIVFDMVYNPIKTTLLSNAISKGAKVIYGTDMLIYQAIEQYKIYTGKSVDEKKTFELKNEIFNRKKDICLVVVGRTIKEMVKNIKISQQKSDFIEIRADYLTRIMNNDIDKIAKNICVDSIFTCRNIKDGGEFKGTYKKQINIIKYAMSLNKFTYFDIDISQVKDCKYELNDKNKNYKMILSYHQFNKCLSYNECVKLVDKMFFNGADVAKIACKIANNKDIFVMLKVLEKYKQEKKIVIFAPMTDNKIIRLLASQYGSWTNFVCLNEKEYTAKGQICIDNYNKIIDLLK